MKLQIDTLIIGAGYSGLILQHELNKLGVKSVIVDKGYAHGFTGDDYIVFAKKEFDFTGDIIDVHTTKIGSGAEPFKQEYTKKVYNRKIAVDIFSGDDEIDNTKGYKIDPTVLMSARNIYSNITVNKIDMHKRIVYGYVTHINKAVEISYKTLVNTLPIHKFAKYIGINLFDKIGLFISYFPVGIKRSTALITAETMKIEYYSDANIPFYRKQYHGNAIYYEYCLNKPYTDNFPYVISPGKFIKQDDDILQKTYSYFELSNIFLVGRNACWNPDFLLDNIVQDNESVKIDHGYIGHINKLYKRLTENV